jgi:NAD(P)-dependent dehydrogenase (short-subunit alcohol dehydrogenase family)
MDLQLEGRRALVTGSTAGIGFAIAQALAAEGGRVVVNGRTQGAVDGACAAIAGATSRLVDGFAGDLSQAAGADAVVKAFPGHLDTRQQSRHLRAKAVRRDSRCRLDAVLRGQRPQRHSPARLCLPHMRAQNWGRIIFISSESGMHIPVEMVHYGMTKTAQIAWRAASPSRWPAPAITVNSVLPGPTRSRGVGDFVGALAEQQGKSVADVEKEFFETARPTSLIKRFASPEEVAALVAYVASPLASATTGAALRVDGAS